MSNGNLPKEPTEEMPRGSSLEEKWLKLRIADSARLMADNQQLLNENQRRLKQDAEYERQLSDATVKAGFGDKWKNSAPLHSEDADEVKILIDSPTTINYDSPPASAPEKPTPPPNEQHGGSWLEKAVLVAALASAPLGGIAGYGLAQLWEPGPQQQESVADTDTTRTIDIEKWVPDHEQEPQ